MKKVLFFIFFSITTYAMAQVPTAFKYQAVARDAAGVLIINTEVAFQISLLQGGPLGTIVYTEKHDTTSNDYGLVNLEIGNGIAVIGDFSTIDWSLGDYFLQIEMDKTGGTNYTLMGTSQLLSVPYARYAESSGNNDDGDWTKSGDNIYTETTGNVGIGTSNPTSKLEIKNAGSGLYENTSQQISIYSDSENAYSRLKFHRSHSPILGDDTSTNAVTLDGNRLGLVAFGGNRINGTAASSTTAGWIEMIQKGSATVSGLPGQLQFITADALGERDTRLVISPTGNVGISTDNPQAKLDIGGKLFFSATLGDSPEGQIDFNNNSGSSERMIIRKNIGSNTFGEINVVSDHDLRFRTNDTDRITIKNNGNVGIGTSNPQGVLDLYNASGTTRLNIDSDSGNGATINLDNSHNEKAAFIYDLTRDLKIINLDTDDDADIIFRVKDNDEVLRLNANGTIEFDGDLDMKGNQSKNFVIENRTSDPSSPAVGQIWIRTDL